MESLVKKVLSVVFLMLTPFGMVGQTISQSHAKQPLICCGDPPFDHEVRLPKYLVNSWLASKMASGLRDMQKEDPQLDLDKFYNAYKVQLTNSGDAAYVVRGLGPPVTGADNDWFWIVGHFSGSARVLLFANGLNLEFLTTESNGFRNVRSFWESAGGDSLTCEYRFSGGRYRLVHKCISRERKSQ